MNLLLHMSYILLLDFAIFRYWYTFANRYNVLNFNEIGFLPGRYIISGLVGGTLIYWLYLIPLPILRRLFKNYHHPRWWLLWIATAVISSTWIIKTVRADSEPQLTIPVTIALVVHLQLIHFIMFMIADRVMYRSLGSILPGVRSAVIFLGLWLFWIWYSFEVTVTASPRPIIGSVIERYILVVLITVLLTLAGIFRLNLDFPFLRRSDLLIPPLNITVSDAIDGFYSAWALFYLVIPPLHYLFRGYVMPHSTLFPAFLLGFFVPLIWSLVLMWLIVIVSKPDVWGLVRGLLPRLLQIWERPTTS